MTQQTKQPRIRFFHKQLNVLANTMYKQKSNKISKMSCNTHDNTS